MRVSFVEPHLKLFGGIRRIIELSNRLTARGVETTIYHPEGTPCEWMEGMATVRPSSEIESVEHEVLIYNDPDPRDFNWVKRARARLKVFYVLELYELSLLTGFQPMIYRPRNRRTLHIRRSLRSGYLTLVNATWLQRWLREHMGIEAELVRGGINRDLFHCVPNVRPSGEIRVLASGDRRERKGTAMIEAAIEIARGQVPGITLATYHGKGIPQEQMAKTYASAHIFVEASRQAGWNNPVAEAMACGTPVVCTDIGGVEDFAFPEETALVVPVDDAAAMAAAIVRLARNPELRERLASRAERHIATFDWEHTTDRLVEVLQAGLKAGRR